MSRINKIHTSTITKVTGKSVRAIVSVYGNVDYQGDRVMAGAFTRSLAKWAASGDPVPVIYSHDWADPFAFLGEVRKFTDTSEGLVVECDLDKDTEFSRQVLKLLETRRMKQWSFAYDVIDERNGPDGANELWELAIIEVGPCLSGANPLTETLSRKSVQAMLAAESGQSLGWAGTSVPKSVVADFRSKIAAETEAFLDSVYDTAQKETNMQTDPEIQRLNDEIYAGAGKPASDDDLRRQLAALGDSKSSAPRGADPGPLAPSLLQAAARFEQNAVRALGLGLVDEASLLMQSARDLRAVVAGRGGDVQEIIDALTPVVQTLRTAGNPIAGDNLERDLVELAGGAAITAPPVEAPKGRFTYDNPNRWIDA